MEEICNSCKKKVTSNEGFTHFLCPECGKTKIIRCTHCRSMAAQYLCHACGFAGPN
ncbi:MAG TPA: zinc finger domain-containing protein [Candidatus Nanoarchaeia archaeon]|nr:zinc finger domain-containing protein [Candidatus Nanoarchaeia archaeon]